MITITRKLEFDAGHRIPDHKSQCRNLHGHRYVMEITLKGRVNEEPGQPDTGMIADFSGVRDLALEHVVSRWDHAFFVYEGDKPVADFLASMPDHKTIVTKKVPTVENLAKLAFDILSPVYAEAYGSVLSLYSIRLYETPNCWAQVDA